MYKSSNTVNIIVADYDNMRLMDTFSKLQNSNPLVRVVAICQNGQDLINRASTMRDVDAILMDFNLIDLTAIEVAKELKDSSPTTEIFCISDSMSAEFIFSAKSKGVAEIFKREGIVYREVADKIVDSIIAKRFEYEKLANEHGAIEKGTRNTKIVKEYITKTISQSVILTYNMKGGVGKSTVAANLAVAIKLSPYYSGKRVVLVDFDCGGANVSTICNIPDIDTVSRNLAAWENIDLNETSPEEVDSLLIPGPHGIMVAAAPINMGIAAKIGYDIADNILKILKKYFDVIIIDGAPNLSPVMDAALEQATKILLIANPEGQAVKQLGRIVHTLNDITANGERDLIHIINKMFVVLNYAQKPSEWDLKPNEVARTIGRPLLREIPNDDVVKKALHGNSAKQAVELEPESEFAIAIKKLANDLCGAYPEGVKQEDVKKSKKKVKENSDKKKLFGLFG